MEPSESSEDVGGFSSSTCAQSVFPLVATLPAGAVTVRIPGRVPDGRPDSRTCWHHDDAIGCRALANKLSLDRETRRLTSIGIDLAVWMHARQAALPLLQQREFLARYEPGRYWNGRTAPPLGLARGAALYHLPDAAGATLGDRFEESPLYPRICTAEREWLRAQRQARLSFFRVMSVRRRSFRMRDWFGALSGRRDVRVATGEIPPEDIAEGHTVFARVIRYRGRHYVDLLQARSSVRECIADPEAAPRAVWKRGNGLRDRTGMTHALFSTWQQET